MPEVLKLAGIVIVVVGLTLRLRTTPVVVAAGIVTGLLAGLPLFSDEGLFRGVPLLTREGQEGIVDMLGRAFADNRLMTLFIVTLPAIGLAERHGLQERAARLVRRMKAATVGRLLLAYQGFRVLTGLLGIRLAGHPAFVRPLLLPMTLGAAEAAAKAESTAALPASEVERIKAANAASENYGNFYGQNLSPILPGVLLVYGVMKGLGHPVDLWRVVLYAVPMVVISLVLGAVQFWLLDRKHRRSAAGR